MRMQSLARFAVAAGALAAMALPSIAGAQQFSFEDLGGTLGLGTADLKQSIIKAVQWLLSFLALIAVVLIIYGGFIWLTAAGNEENVDKAKRIIAAASIGMVIILMSWAIAIFVVRSTSNVTQ